MFNRGADKIAGVHLSRKPRWPPAGARSKERGFDVWPARCLANAFTALAEADLASHTQPDYLLAYDAGKRQNAAAKAKGEGGFGAQWAGQGAPLSRALPADELVARLAAELEDALSRVRRPPRSR